MGTKYDSCFPCSWTHGICMLRSPVCHVQASRCHGSSTIPEALHRELLHFLSDPINYGRQRHRPDNRAGANHHHHHHWAAVVSRGWAKASADTICQMVSLQVVSSPLGWSSLSSFLVIWSPSGDTRGPSVVFEAVDVPCPGPFHFCHIADYI